MSSNITAAAQERGIMLVKFRNIAVFNPDNLSNKTASDFEINYIDIESVNLGVITGFKKHKFGDAPSRAKRKVQKGDILISMVRPYLRAFGILEDISENMVCSTGFAVLRVNPNVNPDYVFRFVMSDAFVNQLIPKMVGANYPAVSVEDIKDCLIPLPMYEEQSIIATILGEADALIQKRKEAIAKLDELVQSVFLEMFGGGMINTEVNDYFELGKLIISGPQNGLYKPASEYGSGFPILRIDSFYDGKVENIESLKRVNISSDELEKYSLNELDIVINRVNSKKYLGKSAIIPRLKEPTVFESNMMRFSVDSTLIDPEYLIYFMQQPIIKKQILSKSRDAVNQSSINQQDVLSLLVYLPYMNIQKKFVAFYRQIEQEKRYMENQLIKLEFNFQSLLHQAFTGQLHFNEGKVDEYAIER